MHKGAGTSIRLRIWSDVRIVLGTTCEKPNKTGHFSSHRIRTVENRGGDPVGPAGQVKLPSLDRPRKRESFEMGAVGASIESFERPSGDGYCF